MWTTRANCDEQREPKNTAQKYNSPQITADKPAKLQRNNPKNNQVNSPNYKRALDTMQQQNKPQKRNRKNATTCEPRNSPVSQYTALDNFVSHKIFSRLLQIILLKCE